MEDAYLSKILNVWVDNNFKTASATPILYIDIEVLDEKYTDLNKFITLSMSAWDFTYKPGANINEEMNNLANAFQVHLGKNIKINIPKNNYLTKNNIKY